MLPLQIYLVDCLPSISLHLRVTRAAKSFPQSHMAQNRVLMVTGGDGDDADVAIIGASSSGTAAAGKGNGVAGASAAVKGKGIARESTTGVVTGGRSTSTTADTGIEVVCEDDKEAQQNTSIVLFV